MKVFVQHCDIERIMFPVRLVFLGKVAKKAPNCGVCTNINFGILALVRKGHHVEALSQKLSRILSETPEDRHRTENYELAGVEQTATNSRILRGSKNYVPKIPIARAFPMLYVLFFGQLAKPFSEPA
jgi:hypothetical protein